MTACRCERRTLSVSRCGHLRVRRILVRDRLWLDRRDRLRQDWRRSTVPGRCSRRRHLGTEDGLHDRREWRRIYERRVIDMLLVVAFLIDSVVAA